MTRFKLGLALLVGATVLIAVGIARAEIEPLIVTLDVDTTDYTVPLGKVFVIESAYSGNRYGTNTSFALVVGTTTNILYIDNWYRKITPIQPPLKIPAESVIRLFDPGEQFLILFGLLVDPEDLYASIRSEFDYATATLAEFESRLTLASPRPARIRMESREDTIEGEWGPVADLLSPTDGNRKQWDVADVIADIEKQYYRAAAQSRVTSGGIRKF